MQHALSVLASTGALQTAVLEAITDRLDELYRLLGEPASADRRMFSTLQELEAHLEALLDNTMAGATGRVGHGGRRLGSAVCILRSPEPQGEPSR